MKCGTEAEEPIVRYVVEGKMDALVDAFRKFMRNTITGDLLDGNEKDAVRAHLCALSQLIAAAKVRDSLRLEKE